MAHTVDHDNFAHLTPAVARLGAVLRRPKPLAVGCVAVFAMLGWLYLGVLAGLSPDGGTLAALCRPAAGPALGFADGAAIFAMWTAMTLAMMLPSAGPMIMTYAEIADTAARKGERIVSPLMLTGGYVAIWLGFSLAATFLQFILVRAAWLDGGINAANGVAAGALFIGAGLYQFSGLKQACLNKCRHPFPFFFMNWTTRAAGVFKLGLRQGLHCLGCCWAMMLLMFAIGGMNVVWMALLGVVMTVEKMTTVRRFSHVVGVVFIAAGLSLMIGEAVGQRN